MCDILIDWSLLLKHDYFHEQMFWDAWKMKPNEAEELQNEAEADINRRERRGVNFINILNAPY